MKYKDIQKSLKSELKPSRYAHTLGVVETAEALADAHGIDIKQAALAALLHDCAKCRSDEDKILLCKNNEVEITESEYANPSLLHAKCGAILAQHLYGVEDADILHAITVHTTGCANMSTLDKIIFIADYIEPNRDKAPNLEKLRKIAPKNLDKTTYQILKDTVDYLNHRKDQVMDPTTIEAYHYYKELVETK